MRRAGDVLAGVTDAWLLQQVGDAGDSTEDEAEFTARRAAEEAEEGSALSAGRSTALRLGGRVAAAPPPTVRDSDAGIHGGGMPEAGTAGACAIRGGAALSPIALASRSAFQVRLRCRACGAQMADSTECAACGVASPAHTAVSDRAKRVRHRATHSEARHLLEDDKRRLGARVSAAQDYHVCDEAEEYAAAVQHRIQRFADAGVSPGTAKGHASMDHEFDS